MGVRRARAILLGVVLVGCNALTGAADLEPDDLLGIDGGALPPRDQPDGGAGARDAGPSVLDDASDDASDDATAGADAAGADATVDAPADTGPTVKRVFASSTTTSGNLGGLTGADARCVQLAQAAGLGGSWVAWLSTNAVAAKDRVTGAGPWHLVGDAQVAVTKAELTAPPIDKAIDRDENGQPVTGIVWTGTGPDGAFFDDDCADWTSGSSAAHACSGTVTVTSQSWTRAQPSDCDVARRLYCFQQ